MSFRVVLGDWDAQQAAARPVRYAVFVIEQHVPLELEWDEMDAASVHALAIADDGSALGTGRLLPDGHIGRMAVVRSARSAGIGAAILEALMQEARRRGDPGVLLHAQTHAEPFYRRFGFVREGGEFMEAGIPHVLMRCRFEPA